MARWGDALTVEFGATNVIALEINILEGGQ